MVRPDSTKHRTKLQFRLATLVWLMLVTCLTLAWLIERFGRADEDTRVQRIQRKYEGQALTQRMRAKSELMRAESELMKARWQIDDLQRHRQSREAEIDAHVREARLWYEKQLVELFPEQTEELRIRPGASHVGIEPTESNLALVRRFGSIRQLTLKRGNLTAAEVQQLVEMEQLRVLSFHGTMVPDATLEALREVSQIERLMLSGSFIEDHELITISKHHHLHELQLAHNRDITDDGLLALFSLPQLVVLELHSTNITDGAVNHLGRMRQLQTLRIDSTRITAEGVARLRKALPNCKLGTSHQ